MMKSTPAIIVLLLAVLFTTAGCNTIPWLMHFFAKPEIVEPVCEIPEDVTILVFVDDLAIMEFTECEPIKRELTGAINDQLLEHEVVAGVVDYRDIIDYEADNPTYSQRLRGDIASDLGADLVLDVALTHFDLTDDEAAMHWQGELYVTIRMMELDNRVLWPTAQISGRSIEVSLSDEGSEFESHGVQLTERVAEAMADKIVKLFYEHEVPAGTAARRQREEDDQDYD